jgi:hypothetical protein
VRQRSGRAQRHQRLHALPDDGEDLQHSSCWQCPLVLGSTDPATNATENIIAEMEGEIVDACALGNNLFIYGANETWRMVADGSTFVFR